MFNAIINPELSNILGKSVLIFVGTMKRFKGFDAISALPKRVKIVGSLLGVLTIGFFTYYLTVINPLFGGAAQPSITTAASTNIKQTGATFNGTVATDGGSPLRSKGFEYGLTTSYGSITSDTTADSYAYAYQWGTQGTGNNQFAGPEGIAKDSAGNVYVIDNGNHRVMKFTSSGTYISKWGNQGTSTGQFNYPHGITIDSSDNIYVADTSNNRIQQFTTAGVFVRSFGSFGTGNGQMIAPSGVAVDVFGNVYVADTLNNRIQKFTNTGTYISKWGSSGTGDYQFNTPYAIDTDPAGNVYVADKANQRIMKYNLNAVFVSKWGTNGTGDGQFQNPAGLALDNYGFVYVADNLNHRIQKFTDSGTYVTQYGSQGSGNANLSYPTSIFTDNVGGVFITDNSNHRILKVTPVMGVGAYNLKVNDLACATTYHFRAFAENGTELGYGADQTVTTTACSTPLVDTLSNINTTTTSSLLRGEVNSVGLSSITDQGFEYGTTNAYGSTVQFASQPYEFALKWGTQGAGDDQFINPTKIVKDASGNFFVLDSGNNRIQKFNASGTYISRFGASGSGNGAFSSPSDLAIDSSGNLYITDTYNSRIQKFDSNGNYISQWGSLGAGNGQFNAPWGIAIDSSNNVYVADTNNNRIQKFNASGTYISQWGSLGAADGQFQVARSVAVNASGDILVGDYGRIQKFNASGTFVSSFGSYGTGNGQIREAWDIAFDSNGNIFVADTFNYRIQEFNDFGQYLNKWGSSGSADGQFNLPYGLSIDASNNVYVADMFNHRIQKFTPSNQTGIYSLSASSLTCGTTYHYRAFASNFYGTANGDDFTFDTLACPLPPSVSTQAASNISGTVARFNGTVDSFNTNNITERGFQYGLTTSYGQTQTVPLTTITDTYSSSSGAILCGTTYHYRAYATNAVGTTYGSDSSFTTRACPLAPTVSTQPASSLSQTSSNLNGTVSSEGSTSISSRGFEYGLDTSYGQSTSESVDIQYAYTGQFGAFGSGASQFSNIQGIAREQNGNILVADIDNNRIMRFDASGTWISNVISGPADGAPSNPFYPKRVTTDSSGNIYTTDSMERVQKFDSNGTYISSFGSSGTGNSQFSNSGGIAVDGDFNIYVADQANNRIQKFDSNGNYITQWGGLGTGNGQFDFPTNIVIDASGAIIVTDFNNSRIQKFDANGNFVSKFGTIGTAEGQLDHPYSIALDGMDNIYISDFYNHRIQKFDSNGTFITSFGSVGSGPGQIATGISLVSSPTGTVYLADNNGGGLLHISRFDPIDSTGAYQLQISSLSCGTTYHYRAIATNSIGTSTGNDQLFTTNVCPLPIPTATTDSVSNLAAGGADMNGTVSSGIDFVNERGFEYGTTSSYGTGSSEQIVHYAFGGSFGAIGSGNGQFDQPSGIGADSSGNVYIADTANNRIQKFDSSGNYISKWGTSGVGAGQFYGPTSVKVGVSGAIYVADVGNQRIQKFDSFGGFIAQWGTYGTTDGNFSNPTALALDSSENVYVVDYSNHRIQKFDSDGTFITKWGTLGSGDGQLAAVKDIAVDGSGYIYVTDNNNHRIQKFDSDGTFITKWGTQGVGITQFNNVQGITAASDGYIYVTDLGNNRVQKYDTGGNLLINVENVPSVYGLTIAADGTLLSADTINNRVMVYSAINNTTSFSLPTGALTCNTLYHYQAYAVNISGIGYGADQTFTTSACPVLAPDVTTQAASAITGTNADLNGTVVSGANSANIRGFEYGLDSNYGQITSDPIVRTPAYAGLFGSFGSGDGQFDSPRDLAIDADQNVFVADLSNNRIQKFDSNGNYLSQFGTAGTGDGQLYGPWGIVIDSGGDIYVSDFYNNRIQKFDSNGNYLSQFGSSGSGDGQFEHPTGLAIDSNNNLYVADYSNNRIQKFDSNGNYLSQFGSSGTGDGQFTGVWSVAIDSSNNVYANDGGQSRVEKFDSNGNYLSQFGSSGSGDGQFLPSSGISVDAYDNVYVSDLNNGRVEKFDSNGNYLSQFGSWGSDDGQFNSPYSVIIDSNDNILVSDTGNNRVQKITQSTNAPEFSLPADNLTCSTTYHYRAFATNNTGTSNGNDQIFATTPCPLALPTVTTQATSTVAETTGTLNGSIVSALPTVTQRGFNYGTSNSYGQVFSESTPPYSFAGKFGSYGSSDGQFASPFQPAVDSQGNIYVIDLDNSRIQKFDPAGVFITKWGSQGTDPGQFFAPTGVTVDINDRVLVADQSNNRIQVFNSSGAFQFTFGSAGPADGQFTEPRAVATDSSGNIFVADTFANRIQKFDSSGNFVSKITYAGPNTSVFYYPMGLDFDSADNLYVADTGHASIKKFDSNGSYLSEFGSAGNLVGEFNNAYGVALDSNDNIYVSDADNHRIQKFSSSGVFLASIGSNGSGDGQLDRPHGITIDSSDNIFVADIVNNRIQKFSPLSWTSNFSNALTNLTCATTYHVQAFATNASGTGVGSDTSFTTSSCPIVAPTVSTLTASSITETSANANGSISYEGTSPVTLRGFQYGLTTSYGSTSSESAGGLGSFSQTLNALTCGKTYHFRAFATNASTTSYGIDRVLNTLSCPSPPPVVETPPTVITQPASNITKTSSTLNATITAQGSSAIITRGFEYGSNGSFGFNTVENSSSIGAFERILNSFVCGTTYTFRAFATNSAGRSYGANQSFTTSECNVAPVVSIVSPTNKQIFPSTTKKIDLSANATSTTSQISRVDFYIDGLLYGSVSVPPYILSAGGISAGNHILTARAFDKTGSSTTSKAVTFTLSAAIVAPTLSQGGRNPSSGGGIALNTLNRETFTRDKPLFGILGALTTPAGAKVFKAAPISLVIFLLILAALYSLQSLYDYSLKRKLIATIHRYELTLTTTNDFISIASHYLNTPAAILSGAVELVTTSKSIPANLAADLTSKINSFNADIKKLLGQQSIETKIDPAKIAGISKNSNPFKDKSVWIPAVIVFGLLGVAGLLSLNISALGTSGARKLIEFGMFILAFVLLALSARSRKISKAARKLKREQLDAQAELYEKRRAFIESTRVMIDTHLQALTIAGSRLKKVPQAKLYFNGLAMIQSLESGLRTIHEATDMKSVASILAVSPQVEKQLGEYEPKLLETGIFMTSSISPNITTRLKPEELQQLVGSVVDNAIKFSKRDDTIHVSLKKSFGKIKLTVVDQGSGVSKDKLYELFQPFARATDSMKYNYEGAGLNLYIDKVILARIGGHIEMKSHQGIGTTVVITMPSIDVRDGLVAPSVITPIKSSSRAIVR
jgi:streptogramin lyase/signal transduction histidine kinase